MPFARTVRGRERQRARARGPRGRPRPLPLGRCPERAAVARARVEQQLAVVADRPATPARDAAMARATAAADDHIARLQDLETRLPETAQPGIERAIDAQQRVHGPAVPSGSPSRPDAGPG